MKLEQQVTSLELSKKLRELGVKQESIFSWVELDGEYRLIDSEPDGWNNGVSTFTVAELGEILGEDLPKIFQNVDRKWILFNPYEGTNTTHNTEADARAKMLAYLLENKLISLPEAA